MFLSHFSATGHEDTILAIMEISLGLDEIVAVAAETRMSEKRH